MTDSGPVVLDTAALLHWPPPRLAGGLVVDGQRAEVERWSPGWALLVEASGIRWSAPSAGSLEEADAVAARTGDLAGLSPVDRELLALALEHGARLVTDDHRLQNCCRAAGLEWEGVAGTGVRSTWRWELRCTGCRRRRSVRKEEAGATPAACAVCGSPQKLVKAR